MDAIKTKAGFIYFNIIALSIFLDFFWKRELEN